MADVIATELIYLTVKPDVVPEDTGNPTGRLFLNSIEQLRDRPTCAAVYWGRAFEYDHRIALVVRKSTEFATVFQFHNPR